MTDPSFYLLHRPDVPWQDYGDVLVAGLTERLPRRDGQLQLERAGPYVPSITVAGDNVVVTDALRRRLAESGLTGFAFRPIHKARIVHLDWIGWDRETEMPQELPDSGDPDDYILQRPHDPALAEAMGELWELVAEEGGELEKVSVGPNPWQARLYLKLDSWAGHDFFRPVGYGFTYVSERARAWLADQPDAWVSLRPALAR